MDNKPTYEELEQRVRELELDAAQMGTTPSQSHKSVYRSMLENISDTVIVTDDYGYIIYVCPNTSINFGISVEEVQEFGTIDKLMGGTLCVYSDLFKKREISNIEWSITHSSGEIRHLLVTAKCINIFGGKVIYVMRNVTERVQLEEQLKESEVRYRSLFEKAPVMVQLVDQDGRLLMVSDNWLEKLGYRRKEVIGREAIDFLTEKSRQQATDVYLQQSSRQEPVKNVLFTMLKKNGETIDVALFSTAEEDGDGNLLRSYAVLIDCDDIIQTPKAFQESDSR